MFLLLLALLGLPIFAQTLDCPGARAWTPCDFTFDLTGGENPDNFQLRVEFRSPRHRTIAMNSFRDGDRRFVVRFTPNEAGQWDYRISSSAARLDGQEGKLSAASSDAPGFVRAANVHHFATDNAKPHLWMSTRVDDFLKIPRPEFDQLVEQRAKEKFTHLRVTLEAGADLHEAAERVSKIHSQGMVVDLVVSSLPENPADRQKYVTDLAARFSAFNLIWMGLSGFEGTPRAKPALKDFGQLLRRFDPYDHPRAALAAVTSASVTGDQWMNLFTYGITDPNIGSVEHQFFNAPAVNTGIQSVRDLWNATMNGQYAGNGSGPHMTAWFDFMSGTRFWDLEPYFDVDGGRALALDGVEYIVYVEKPGPVEVTTENHSYQVYWVNPLNGEKTKLKDYKGLRFTGEPPDKSHEWILDLSRDGRKEDMLKSYKFESRPVPIQEIETNSDKTPFEVISPAAGDVSLANPPRFELKIKRDTKATRSLLIEWTGEVIADGEGFRVVGTGTSGTWQLPKNMVRNLPAALSVHVNILNANGKAYQIDKVYRLVP